MGFQNRPKYRRGMSTYEKIFGDTDPFKFKCPVPGEVEKVFLSYEKRVHGCWGYLLGMKNYPVMLGL